MGFLTEWITNIIVFILLATIFDMLLPRSALQKYTKLVIGLLLIAIILTPLFTLISTEFEEVITAIGQLDKMTEKERLENNIEMKKTEIEESQRAYILEQMAVQLKKDAKEEIYEQFGLAIDQIMIYENEGEHGSFPDNVQKISVLLTSEIIENDEIAVVRKIEINTDTPFHSHKQTNKEKEIALILAEKWDMAEKVEVTVQEEVVKEDV